MSQVGGFALAAVLALLLQRLNVPGGLVLGAMIGAAAVRLASGGDATPTHPTLLTVALIVLGAEVGGTVTRELVGQLPKIGVGAVVAGVAITVCGLGIAFALRALGLAPEGAVLATSPGALNALVGVASTQGTAAVVAVYHTVRIVIVIVSLPLLLRLER